MAKTFELRILKSSWGIAIDLGAEAYWQFEQPHGLLKAGGHTWLDTSPVTLGPKDVEQLRQGLSRVSPAIESQRPGHHIVIEVQSVNYTPTDYQLEGMAAAMIGWATEEFGLPQPDLEVRFDRNENRYVFRW